MRKELREKRNSAVEAMENLLNTAKAENRPLTADEQVEFNNHKQMIEAIDMTTEMEKSMGNYAPMIIKPETPQPTNQFDIDVKNFAGYIRNTVTGIYNNDVNLTKGDNGAIIPITIASKIIDKVVEICPIYAMATKYNVKGTLHIPVVDTTTDIKTGYADEWSEAASTSAKLKSIDLTGYLHRTLVKISKSLLNNSDLNLTNWVIDRMSIKIKEFIENQLINGTESKILGVARSYDSTKMKLTLGKKSSVASDELIELQEMIPDEYQPNACWIMNKSTRTEIRKLKDGQNNYLLQRDFSDPAKYTLLGKPIYTSDNMPKLGTATNLAIMYGDFSGLAVKETETAELQVLNEKYAEQHAIGIVAWGEIDAKVENTQKIACAVCGNSDA